jgi:hypothetical protein
LNYCLEDVTNLFYNFKLKYNPVRRKIYKIRKLYYKLQCLNLRKLNLIRDSLISIFFVSIKSNYSNEVSNGSYYTYINDFDKSIAFSLLNKIQNF